MAKLAEYLDRIRRREFVGRAAERALFQTALGGTGFSYPILYLHGPGGVGKTSLLRAFQVMAEEAGVRAVYLDAHPIEPTPAAFMVAFAAALELNPSEPLFQALADPSCRRVILLDTYEALAPIETWFRDEFLAQLPENILFVIAGRDQPPLVWRTDPGWRTLVHIHPLRNLSLEEGRIFLRQRAVPEAQHPGILAFTHGHPLALALVVDVLAQKPGLAFTEETTSPDVIRTLLDHFVREVPDPTHRMALEACALARFTTVPLLAKVVDEAAAERLFAWLRGLSFIEHNPNGLFPHDLVRDVLVADFRWRNPDGYTALHHRARAFYTECLQSARPHEHRQILADYTFLHRDNPVVKPLFTALKAQWEQSGNLTTDTLRETDRPRILDMVARHEGDASARIADAWIDRRPESLLVVRNAEGQPDGFLLTLPLDELEPDEHALDPAVAHALAYLERHAPLRRGERAALFRFWMAAETYQAISPAQSLLFAWTVRHYLTTPGLAFTFLPCAHPGFWALIFAFADLHRLPEADFEVGGRRYGMYGHDWRALPPAAWLDLIASREISAIPAAAPRPAARFVVLDRETFASAVGDALRVFTQPDLMLKNPLLRARMVYERIHTEADQTDRKRVEVLSALLCEAARELTLSRNDTKLYNALYHTFFEPAPSQEQAAEHLDVPYSSFRRHLKQGLERMVDLLWNREIGESGART